MLLDPPADKEQYIIFRHGNLYWLCSIVKKKKKKKKKTTKKAKTKKNHQLMKQQPAEIVLILNMLSTCWSLSHV